MIHYALHCAEGHEFEGWFADSASFESQEKRGLLECPFCASKSVTRALMAPSVPKKRQDVVVAKQQAPVPVPARTGAPVPAQVMAMLQRMRSEIERHCDYVGESFADEARRMHRGEIDPRGIYGETSPEQAEALLDEGIEIASIPWVPRADG
jgi:hypothetical protein